MVPGSAGFAAAEGFAASRRILPATATATATSLVIAISTSFTGHVVGLVSLIVTVHVVRPVDGFHVLSQGARVGVAFLAAGKFAEVWFLETK